MTEYDRFVGEAESRASDYLRRWMKDPYFRAVILSPNEVRMARQQVREDNEAAARVWQERGLKRHPRLR